MTYYEIEFEDPFKKDNVEPKIISDGDEIRGNYGMDLVSLTDEHIKALQEGKTLYVDVNCGEYCCLLKKV